MTVKAGRKGQEGKQTKQRAGGRLDRLAVQACEGVLAWPNQVVQGRMRNSRCWQGRAGKNYTICRQPASGCWALDGQESGSRSRVGIKTQDPERKTHQSTIQSRRWGRYCCHFSSIILLPSAPTTTHTCLFLSLDHSHDTITTTISEKRSTKQLITGCFTAARAGHGNPYRA